MMKNMELSFLGLEKALESKNNKTSSTHEGNNNKTVKVYGDDRKAG